MVPFERALVGSYRPFIVTFPPAFHVSEILPLLISRMLFFPTPRLVYPKFPHVPLGVRGSPFGCKVRRCWAYSVYSQFPRFPTYVITIHQRHRQTDDMRLQDRAAVTRWCSESAYVCQVNYYSFYIVLSARQHAERTICYRKSVRLSVRHMGGSVENG